MSTSRFAAFTTLLGAAMVALILAGRFFGPEDTPLPKRWQARLYFPQNPGDAPLAPPRVNSPGFPGPLP
jgi:hypothetical protein